MIIKIKNMVSLRCVMAVETELKNLKISYQEISLGEVRLNKELAAPLRLALKTNLALNGLELIFDKKLLLVERIQQAIVEVFKVEGEQNSKPNYPEYLSQKLDTKYTSLATLFSNVTGITLKQFIIESRIHRVKELLLSGLRPIDISYQMGYSSLAHLSFQFKKNTGQTLSFYRSLGVQS